MLLISVMPALDTIGRSDTNMYIQYDNKGQGIDWHSQSDSLGVSPLKQTHSTDPFVSGLRHLVESLRQLTCFIGCFSCSAANANSTAPIGARVAIRLTAPRQKKA